MNAPLIQLVGQRLTPELATLVRELREIAVVYRFTSTRDLIAAWQLARRNDAAECVAPAAVIWLQTRPGEFRQREIEVVAEQDPLARPIVVAGCYSEGEPRSGKPLQGVTRVYWHQGVSSIVSLIHRQPPPLHVESRWAAIHTAQLVDYQGLAAVCQSMGLPTIWQNDRWPAISSEPALRFFVHWEAWQAWRDRPEVARSPRAREILLLSFPRPADFERATACGISGVIAQPFTASDLQRAIGSARQVPRRATLRFVTGSSSAPVVRQLQSA